MDLKTLLESNLKDAMRTNNDLVRRTLRMVLAAIKLAEVEKGQKLDDAAVIAILQKEIKGRNEAINDAQRAGRADIIVDNQAEIGVLESYLPKQMSDPELHELVSSVISELGASSPADMGKVIKASLVKVAGRAPNDRVSEIGRASCRERVYVLV